MDATLIAEARAALETLTPLAADCGHLCGAACCLPDEDGQGGVYLFPGEETLTQPDWGRVVPDDFAPMLLCDGPCDRAQRPLGCRIFPLTPAKTRDGAWTVRMDARARGMCPLVRSGVRGLQPAFVEAVKEAIARLASNPEGEAFLERWMALEAQYRVARL